eukprot:UN22081
MNFYYNYDTSHVLKIKYARFMTDKSRVRVYPNNFVVVVIFNAS